MTALVPTPLPVAGALPSESVIRPTDEALIEAFMASPRQSPLNTRHRRARALHQLASSLSCPLIEATTAQIARWLSRPIADATRVSTLCHLHAFLTGRWHRDSSRRRPPRSSGGRGTAGLTLAPTPGAIQMNSPDEVSVALVQVSPAVELYRVTLELGRCECCGDQDDRLRGLGGVGGPLCPSCYQRSRRAARKAGEALRTPPGKPRPPTCAAS